MFALFLCAVLFSPIDNRIAVSKSIYVTISLLLFNLFIYIFSNKDNTIGRTKSIQSFLFTLHTSFGGAERFFSITSTNKITHCFLRCENSICKTVFSGKSLLTEKKNCTVSHPMNIVRARTVLR